MCFVIDVDRRAAQPSANPKVCLDFSFLTYLFIGGLTGGLIPKISKCIEWQCLPVSILGIYLFFHIPGNIKMRHGFLVTNKTDVTSVNKSIEHFSSHNSPCTRMKP